MTSSGDSIRLREYVDLRIADLKESLTTRERISEQQIKLAADELSRRLEILNHAHQQAVEVQQTYVPREIFEQTTDDLNKRIIGLERFVWGVAAVIAALGFVIPLALRYAANK